MTEQSLFEQSIRAELVKAAFSGYRWKRGHRAWIQSGTETRTSDLGSARLRGPKIVTESVQNAFGWMALSANLSRPNRLMGARLDDGPGRNFLGAACHPKPATLEGVAVAFQSGVLLELKSCAQARPVDGAVTRHDRVANCCTSIASMAVGSWLRECLKKHGVTGHSLRSRPITSIRESRSIYWGNAASWSSRPGGNMPHRFAPFEPHQGWPTAIETWAQLGPVPGWFTRGRRQNGVSTESSSVRGIGD